MTSAVAPSGVDDDARRTWDELWSTRHGAVEATYSNDDRLRRELSKLIDLEGAMLLEVGGGAGRDGASLAEAGAIVTEVDYSQNALRILGESAATTPGLNAVGGDAFRLPFRDGSFDVVFHQGLLEHFDKPQAAALLSENIRVLRPGGLLLVDVPQRWHPYTAMKRVLISLDKWFAGWERSFSIRELTRLVQGLGLDPVHRYGDWLYPALGYRIIWRVSRRLGREIPLQPARVPGLTDVRAAARRRLSGTRLPLLTGISVGVVARKPGGPDDRRTGAFDEGYVPVAL